MGPPADLPKTFTREWVIRRMKQGSIKGAEQQEIRRRYDAELAYTSNQVDRFLSALDAMAKQYARRDFIPTMERSSGNTMVSNTITPYMMM